MEEKTLGNFKRKTDWLVCVDSDGCVFDTMEIKHKECFIPNIIEHWDLQAVSKYARYAAEYVNLYSKKRGTNRFPALIETIDLLSEWDDVLKRGFKAPDITALREWVAVETKLGNPALEKYVAEHPDDELMKKTLVWSTAVNDTIAHFVHGVPPFPYVRESFEKLAGKADIVVVSATPNDALVREWDEHDIAKYTSFIAGQEMGSKKECIRLAKLEGYADDHVIMIGDAPGDRKAAVANNALFCPIVPNCEDLSWKEFAVVGIDTFLSGKFAGEYEDKLNAEFDDSLPATPWWKK